MTGSIIARKEGSLKYPAYYGGTLQYWGDIESQIREATAENLSNHSSVHHTEMNLYVYVEDCPHSTPETDEKYEGVDDLIDEWVARNCAGLTSTDHRFGHPAWQLWYKQRKRAIANIPLASEYYRLMSEWEDLHDGRVCMASPTGSCCRGCTDGDEDFGYEPGGCQRQHFAKEAQEEFWWYFSDENDEAEKAGEL